MAVLGLLICKTCQESTCLGKWLRHEPNVGFGFWRGGISYEDLGLKTLNFLARHTNHEIMMLSDDEYETRSFTDRTDYRSVEDELRTDWPNDANR